MTGTPAPPVQPFRAMQPVASKPCIQGDGTRSSVLAEYRDLASVTALPHVPPKQPARFRNAQTSRVQKCEEHTISRTLSGFQQPLDFRLPNDPLG